jgi:TolB-like protein/tRNA A-37 threonylcarbamoyl transferase component Bud32/Flp pilus assembly protein TadD
MIGKTISHYKILEKLGEGGMGVIYKARDTKLKRTLALKFLPPELTRDSEAKKRFLHEAQAAAALEHQNICNIYEIDESEDQIFIVMGYVEGLNLKEKIDSGPLKIGEAIDIAVQAAEGLQEAHGKGVVHRDIKSANIMINEKGQVKILDFGLAKLKGQTRLTKEGFRLGTAAYMSPEQSQGEDIDCRSDIWSLGVVLYEMISGQLPFKGEYEPAMIYSIMNEDPEPLTALRTRVPMELERIINKALSKDPRERYQHAEDLLVDLRRLKKEFKPEVKSAKKELGQKLSKKTSRKILLLGSLILVAIFIVFAFLLFNGIDKKEPLKTGVINQVRKIAVLPFVNMSTDKDQEYFCDGISEELMNRLAKLSGFRVTARTSAFSLKGKNLDIPSIGKRLKVDIILEGSVRKEGNRLRITAKLIKVPDGFQLWSDTYDRLMKDVFAIQDEISFSIVEKLKVSLLKEESSELKTRPTNNVEAYNFYLRGISYYNRGYDDKDLRLAVRMFEKAIARDPDFALAYAWLAKAFMNLYWFEPYDDTDYILLAKARSAVDKAFKLSPGLPEAHVALGEYYYHGHIDYDHALEQFKIAQKSLKNNTELLDGIAAIQRRQGKWEQSVLNFRKSLEINLLSHTTAHDLGHNYVYLRRYQEAENTYNRVLSLVPDFLYTYYWKIRLYLLWQGSIEKAFKVLAEAPDTIHTSDYYNIVKTLVQLYVYKGEYKKALKQLTFFSDDIDKEIWRAWIYGLLKQTELEKKHYDSARVILEKFVRENPEYTGRSHSVFGLIYAGLGRKEEAIREGKRAVELFPITEDALFRGPDNLLNLAYIYLMVGEYDLAIDQLEFLLSIPSPISIPLLRIDPTWDRLHLHPRFQKLLKGKE